MKSIDAYLLEHLSSIFIDERLKLNNDSRINDSQYGFNDIEELILNSNKISKKIRESDSLTSDPSLNVSGSILHYNDKGINTGIEHKAFVFNINIKGGEKERFILLQDEDKIQAYHIIFGYKKVKDKLIFSKDKILDFTQPNNDKLDIANDANKFYVSNANQFVNYIIQMVNELFKTNSLSKRIEKIKKYAELCKRYIIL